MQFSQLLRRGPLYTGFLGGKLMASLGFKIRHKSHLLVISASPKLPHHVSRRVSALRRQRQLNESQQVGTKTQGRCSSLDVVTYRGLHMSEGQGEGMAYDQAQGMSVLQETQGWASRNGQTLEPN